MTFHLADGTTRIIRPGEATMGLHVVSIEITAEDAAKMPADAGEYFLTLLTRFVPHTPGNN